MVVDARCGGRGRSMGRKQRTDRRTLTPIARGPAEVRFTSILHFALRLDTANQSYNHDNPLQVKLSILDLQETSATIGSKAFLVALWRYKERSFFSTATKGYE